MISVNLLPKEERSEELRLGRPRVRFLLWLAGSVVLVLVLGGSLLVQEMRIQSLRDDILLAEQESAHLKEQAETVARLEQKCQGLESRLSLVFDLSRDRKMSLMLMDELAAQVPEHLWLTRISQSGPETQLVEGVTFSNLLIADLMGRMQRTDLYDGVDLTVAERAYIGEETVVEFSLTARIAR